VTNTESLGIEIKSALACDDIRFEQNGKALLVGVYIADIVLREFPASFVMSYWLSAKINSVGEHSWKFRLLLNDELKADGTASIDAVGTGEAGIPLGKIPLKIDEEGTLTLECMNNETGTWDTILNKKFIQDENATTFSNETEPPS